MIRLSTIGPISIYIGDKRVRTANHKVVALLFHLIVERGNPVPRRTLQDLLFPDAEENPESHPQRQLLYRLRRLGVDVKGDGATVTLPADSATWDVDTLVERGHALPAEIEALQRGYLRDYEPRHSERFTRWLEEHREQTVTRLRSVLIGQLKDDRARRRFRDLERVARACLALDPLNEEATLIAAESLLMAGAKSDALRLLDDYLEEVGSRSPHLRIAPRVLRERISEYTVQPDRDPAPLTGRDAELASISAIVDQTASGEARACIVSGPSGIGKTRLLNEVTSIAALGGHAVIRCKLYQHDAGRPFSVLRELGPALLDLPGSLGASPAAVAGLRGLCGRGPSQYTDLPTGTFDTEAIVNTIHDHVIEVIDAVAEEQPVIMVIEDGHWIDAASLELVSAALGGQRRLCVLIATQRPLMLPAGLASSAAVAHVPLSPLSQDESHELLASLFGTVSRAVKREFVELASRIAGGNPFYLQLLFNNYIQTGDPAALPPSLSVSLAARLEQLTEPARGVFDAIVILGPASNEARLERVTELPRFALASALRELEESGLVLGTRDIVAASHELFANTARSRMPATVARLLHRAVAHTLELEEGGATSLLVASHWEACGEPKRAFTVLLAAAKEYTHLGRPQDAMELLARARQHAADHQDEEFFDRALLHACRAAGEDRQGVAAAERLGLYAGSGSPEDRLIAIEMKAMAGSGAAEYMHLLVAMAGNRSLNVDTRARAAAALLIEADLRGSADLGATAYQYANDLPNDNANVMYARLIFATAFGSPDAALECASQLCKLATTLPAHLRARYTSGAGFAIYRCGHVSQAIPFFEEAYDIAKAGKVWTTCVDIASVLADMHWDNGDLTLAEKWFSIASEHTKTKPKEDWALQYFSVGALLAIDRGDYANASTLLDDLQRLYPRIRNERRGLLHLAVSIRLDLARGLTPEPSKLESLVAGHLERRGDEFNDLVADTVISALICSGRSEQAALLRHEYLTHFRKDRIPVPISMKHLRANEST